MILNERVFRGKRNIKYLLFTKKSKHLVIMFSAYSNDPQIKARYNYLKTLDGLNCNRLYILDNFGYDGRGCWYLCEDGSFDIEYSVFSLIEEVRNRLDIDKENVIVCGTSKGGFASLYYALKYGYKNIITGSPQTLLGNYIVKIPKIVRAMVSCEQVEIAQSIDKFNSLLFNNPLKNKNIIIFTGISDSHLQEHCVPFLNSLDLTLNNVSFHVYNGTHSDIGVVFNKLILNLINDLINEQVIYTYPMEYKMLIEDNTVFDFKNKINKKIANLNIINEDTLALEIEILNINFKYAYYLYIDNIKVSETKYQRSSYFEIKTKVRDKLRIKLFIMDTRNNIVFFNCYINNTQ